MKNATLLLHTSEREALPMVLIEALASGTKIVASNCEYGSNEILKDKYSKYIANQNDVEFGRNTGMEKNISVGPFYAIKIAPGVHHTMGGVEINTNAEVISEEDTVIPGLFAAGEVAGGVHGGNRIGGTAVTDFVVFGRIAGQSAGKFVNR